MTPACSLGHAKGHGANADQPESLRLWMMETDGGTYRDGEISPESLGMEK